MEVAAGWLDLGLGAGTRGKEPGVQVLLLLENSKSFFFEQTGLGCLGFSKKIRKVGFSDALHTNWRVGRQCISERASTLLTIENCRLHQP